MHYPVEQIPVPRSKPNVLKPPPPLCWHYTKHFLFLFQNNRIFAVPFSCRSPWSCQVNLVENNILDGSFSSVLRCIHDEYRIGCWERSTHWSKSNTNRVKEHKTVSHNPKSCRESSRADLIIFWWDHTLIWQQCYCHVRFKNTCPPLIVILHKFFLHIKWHINVSVIYFPDHMIKK